MTFEEFIPTVGRLRTVYGEKAFPQERVDVIYRAVQYTTLDVWQETLTELIGEAMHAPPLSKIKETMYLVRKRMGQTSDAWEPIRKEIEALGREKIYCHQCFNSGIFMAYRRNDSHQYLYCFGCDCRVGDLAMRLPENRGKIRQWNLAIATDWHREGTEPPRRPATRQDARNAVAAAFKGKDLNEAIGGSPNDKRGYDDEKWDQDL